ncbi:MAG TPA: MXAN_2562 family outer membrane beta-barrel protein [Polyangiaceae bacterium]|nr:MXAN_2562 family outer membrane beta-barrel protein [Polyangiaceae bacterium]
MRRSRVLGAIAGALTLLTFSLEASAQGSADSDASWRRGTARRESDQTWAFELRFGPYRPNVDDEFEGGAAPYREVFGDSKRVFFGMELDWQALRIPWVGTFGPGVGWSYTSMSSKAKLSGTNVDSAEETSLWLMPMYAAGVLRVDVLPRELSIPLVPYGKLGLGYGLWKASNELGASEQGGVTGKGHSYGLHAAVGLALQLDFLDAAATQQLDNSVGINHAYGYLEWMWSDLGGFGGGQMKIGTSTWVTGLAFEI